MLTLATYAGLAENALEQYNRFLRTYPQGSKIIFVVSVDVLDAAMQYEDSWRTVYDPIEMKTRMRFCGLDVYVAIGGDESSLFAPAVLLDESANQTTSLFNCAQHGDLLCDDRLFIYDAARNGYKGTELLIQDGVTDELAFKIRSGVFNLAFDRLPQEVSFATACVADVDGGANYRAIYERLTKLKRKAKQRTEQELSPGDTKALDDFLSEFARQGLLSEA